MDKMIHQSPVLICKAMGGPCVILRKILDTSKSGRPREIGGDNFQTCRNEQKLTGMKKSKYDTNTTNQKRRRTLPLRRSSQKEKHATFIAPTSEKRYQTEIYNYMYARIGASVVALSSRKDKKLCSQIIKTEAAKLLIDIALCFKKDHFVRLCAVRSLVCICLASCQVKGNKDMIENLVRTGAIRALTSLLTEASKNIDGEETSTNMETAESANRNSVSMAAWHYEVILTSLQALCAVFGCQRKNSSSYSVYRLIIDEAFTSELLNLLTAIVEPQAKCIPKKDGKSATIEPTYFFYGLLVLISRQLVEFVHEDGSVEIERKWCKNIVESGIIRFVVFDVEARVYKYQQDIDQSAMPSTYNEDMTASSTNIEAKSDFVADPSYVMFSILNSAYQYSKLRPGKSTSLSTLFWAATEAGMGTQTVECITNTKLWGKKNCHAGITSLLHASVIFFDIACMLIGSKQPRDLKQPHKTLSQKISNKSRRNIIDHNKTKRIERDRNKRGHGTSSSKLSRRFPKSSSRLEDASSSRLSMIEFICTRGCMATLVWLLVHEEETICTHAACIIDKLFNEVDIDKMNLRKKQKNEKRFVGQEYLVGSLIEQACVPILFGIRQTYSSIGSEKVSRVIDTIIKKTFVALSANETGKDIECNDHCYHLMNTFQMSDCSKLKANTCIGMFLLCFDGKCKKEDFGKQQYISQIIFGAIFTMLRKSEFKQAQLFFNAMKACLEFWEQVPLQDDDIRSLINKHMPPGAGAIEPMQKSFLSKEEQVTIWVDSTENPTKVKMNCPPITELSLLAPKLSKKIIAKAECQGISQDEESKDTMVVIQCSSYHLMEELMSHISSWDYVCHMPNEYDMEFCLGLLELAHYFGSECLEKVYKDMCLEKMVLKEAINVFETSLNINQMELTFISFRLLVQDIAASFEEFNGQRETNHAIKILRTFFNLLVHHK